MTKMFFYLVPIADIRNQLNELAHDRNAAMLRYDEAMAAFRQELNDVALLKLRARYDEELNRWEALPFFKRMKTPRPEFASGYDWAYITIHAEKSNQDVILDLRRIHKLIKVEDVHAFDHQRPD